MCTFDINCFMCMYPMNTSYEEHLKTIWHVAGTGTFHTLYIYVLLPLRILYFIYISFLMTSYAHFRNIYSQHTYIFHNIHIIITSKYVMILTTVICEHKVQTIHQYIYLFFKHYKHTHFGYQLLRCILPMKKWYHNKLQTILYL